MIDNITASYIQTKHKKTIVLWDTNPGGTPPGKLDDKYNFYVESFKSLATEGADSTHLALTKESIPITVLAALYSTVDALNEAGITLLTVADCLDLEPYEHVGSYGERDDTWTCDRGGR